MSKITAIAKGFKSLLPKINKNSTAIKAQTSSIFQNVPNNVRYINNVVSYHPRKLITPEEVRELFVDSEIGGENLKKQMQWLKFVMLYKSVLRPSYFKRWMHSVDLSAKLTKNDCQEISNFMNLHNGKYANIWKGYSKTDMIPNIEKLALFTRSLKRIEKLDFYKGLDEKTWENCIDGIISKPQEVIRPLIEYKFDSRNINNSISNGIAKSTIRKQINIITKFLDKQITKHDMYVYRGEGGFGVFSSVNLDKNYTLNQALEAFTARIESKKINAKVIKNFIRQNLKNKTVKQERFMSTAIDPDAIEKYAEKVFWKIKLPKNTKASMIESYNVERESETEMLVQRMSKLLINHAKYVKKNHRWYIEAELKQDDIVLDAF